jgi:hypothetical protein
MYAMLIATGPVWRPFRFHSPPYSNAPRRNRAFVCSLRSFVAHFGWLRSEAVATTSAASAFQKGKVSIRVKLDTICEANYGGPRAQVPRALDSGLAKARRSADDMRNSEACMGALRSLWTPPWGVPNIYNPGLQLVSRLIRGRDEVPETAKKGSRSSYDMLRSDCLYLFNVTHVCMPVYVNWKTILRVG